MFKRLPALAPAITPQYYQGFAMGEGNALMGWGWDWPVGSHVITQYYHEGHKAIDIGSLPVGSEVSAPASGEITYAGWSDSGYGNLVVVSSGGYNIYLGHLSEISVSLGDNVEQGQKVGESGNTGNSTGPHLHLEIRKGCCEWIDPLATVWGDDDGNGNGNGKPPKVPSPPGNGDGEGSLIPGFIGDILGLEKINYKKIAGLGAVLVVGIILVGIGTYGIVMGEAARAEGSEIGQAIGKVVKAAV